jgi:glycosyltransferase involved in cell wall biosynthesis
MRITLVTTSWPSGPGDPSGHFVQAHARALERQGHAVAVVAPLSGGAFGWPGVASRLREQPVRALGAARWVAAARRRVAEARADRVVAHWSVPCGWPIAMGARSPALDLVSLGGDVRLLARWPALVRKAVVGALAARADSWTFVSSALLESLLMTLDCATRVRVDRIARIEAPPLEMPDVAGAVARRRQELAGARVAVCVGRLVASKRVDLVIEHCARERPFGLLVVVGDGPERDRLQALARSRGLATRFVGHASRPDAVAWIGAADALIHASEAEGLSTVVREAEALAVPVVRVEP